MAYGHPQSPLHRRSSRNPMSMNASRTLSIDPMMDGEFF